MKSSSPFSGDFTPKGHQIGAAAGILTGLILFFNLPSLTGFLLNTIICSVSLGIIGYLKSRKGSFWASGGFILFLLVFILPSAVSSCSLMGTTHEPARNSFTGEIDGDGGFEGFRLMSCDDGEYPWYYSELDDTKIQSFCSENADANYCMLQRSGDRNPVG